MTARELLAELRRCGFDLVKCDDGEYRHRRISTDPCQFPPGLMAEMAAKRADVVFELECEAVDRLIAESLPKDDPTPDPTDEIWPWPCVESGDLFWHNETMPVLFAGSEADRGVEPMTDDPKVGRLVRFRNRVWLVVRIGWLGWKRGSPHAVALWLTRDPTRPEFVDPWFEELLFDFRTGRDYDAGRDMGGPVSLAMPLGPLFLGPRHRADMEAEVPRVLKAIELKRKSRAKGFRPLFGGDDD